MSVKYLKCGVVYEGRNYGANGVNNAYTKSVAPIMNSWAMMDGDYFDIEVYNVTMGSKGVWHRRTASAYETNETSNIVFTNNIPTDCDAPTTVNFPERIYTDQYVKFLSFPGILFGYNYVVGAPIVWRVTCRQKDNNLNNEPYLEVTMPMYNMDDNIWGPICPPYNLRSVMVDSVNDRLACLELADNEILPTGVGMDVPMYQSFRPRTNANTPPVALTSGIVRRPPMMLLDDSCVGTSSGWYPCIYSSAGLGANPTAASVYFRANSNEHYRMAFHSQSNRDILAQIERTIRNSLYEYGVKDNGTTNGRPTYSTISTEVTTISNHGTGNGQQVWAGPILYQSTANAIADTYWYNSILSIIAGNGGGPGGSADPTTNNNTLFTNNLFGLGFDNSPGWVIPMASAGIFGFPGNTPYAAWRSMPFLDIRTSQTPMPSNPFCMKKWGDEVYCGSFSLWRIKDSNLNTANQYVTQNSAPNHLNMPFMGMYNIFQRDLLQEAIRDRLITQYLTTPTYATTSSASNWPSSIRSCPWNEYNGTWPLLSENCGINLTQIAANGNGYFPTGASGTNLPYVADTLVGYEETANGQMRYAFPTGLSTNVRRKFGSVGIHIASTIYTGSGLAPLNNTCLNAYYPSNSNKINCYVIPSLFSDWVALDIYGLERKTAYNNKITSAFKWQLSSHLTDTEAQVQEQGAQGFSTGFQTYDNLIKSKKVTIYNTFAN